MVHAGAVPPVDVEVVAAAVLDAVVVDALVVLPPPLAGPASPSGGAAD
jgi:hypothetical protein